MRIAATALATLTLLGQARPVSAQLQLAEAGSLKLVYIAPSETFLVPHATQTFLNSATFLEKLFDYVPSEKITVLLADFSDTGNAGAGSVPFNGMRVQIAPLSFTFETIVAGERMRTIMGHEMVHVIAMDQAAGRDHAFRRLFGGKVMPIDEQPETILYFFLTSPRVAAPRWYHEGAATFVDTWMAGGFGRAQGGYDEMVFRSMVKDGTPIYDPLGLVSEGTMIDFQVEVNSYLYGTRFMTWLAYEHSPSRVIQWMSRKPGSRAYYARQFQHVFGTPLATAWSRWLAFERTFQQANLAEIKKHPTTPYVDLSPRALGSVSRAHYDPATRTIYAGMNYPGVVAHIGAISTTTGETTRFTDIKGPLIYQVTSLAMDPAGPILYYTTDNTAYRDLVALDPTTGRRRVLLKDARIGDLVFSRADRHLWGVRHLNGIATLVELAPPYTDWKQVASFPYGTVVFDVDVSPDGTLVSASFGAPTGRQSVRVMSVDRLRKGDVTPVAEFDFESSVPGNFVFSPDGRYLYGSAYYTGVSNIFRYEIATQAKEAVTNTETGFFRPIPLGNDELIVFRYTGQGWVPARITATPIQDVNPITFLGERTFDRHPELKSWAISSGSPANTPAGQASPTERPYRLGGNLRVESFYPIVQGYKDTAAVGMRLNFSDPLQFNRLHFSGSYSPSEDLAAEERVHVAARYQRYDWDLEASYNNADFYDLVGPTKSGRKGYSVSLLNTRTLIFDEPRRMTLELKGGVAGNLDQLPQYQNVPVDVDQLVSFIGRLKNAYVRSSLGHVDDEKGRVWSTAMEADYVNRTAVMRALATFDAGLAVPLPHSSIWLRTAAGFSPQDRSEPFANFYFGGFGNNYIDRGDAKRYREYQSFPGAELNEIGGRNFTKVMIEWNLPPLRFKRVGTSGAYLSWLRPSIFAAGLVTDMDSAPDRRKAASVGAQIDLRFTVLSVLDMTLSAGGAVRTEAGVPQRTELMVSLSVLK
jgi:hypothetical protein